MSPVAYTPRNPAASVLDTVVHEHVETFRVEAARLRDGRGCRGSLTPSSTRSCAAASSRADIQSTFSSTSSDYPRFQMQQEVYGPIAGFSFALFQRFSWPGSSPGSLTHRLCSQIGKA